MDKHVSSDLVDKLGRLGPALRTRILGQNEVLSDIVSLLQRVFCNFRFPGRPLGSMLFLGPTGVGKTETAVLFTDHLFGSVDKLVRFDMSEYMTLDSLGILRGRTENERGMFGHYYDHSGGSGTLLFDEIEKAHPLIIDVLLQILSAGRFTVASGETLDLSNYIVVATSNIGSRMLTESRSSDRQTLVRRTLGVGMQEMRPETFARFDLHCVFNKLDYLTLHQIAALHLVDCIKLAKNLGHQIECQPGVIEYVQREGYSERFGARPMQNAALRIVGETIAKEVLGNDGRTVRGSIGYNPMENKAFFQWAS